MRNLFAGVALARGVVEPRGAGEASIFLRRKRLRDGYWVARSCIHPLLAPRLMKMGSAIRWRRVIRTGARRFPPNSTRCDPRRSGETRRAE